MQLSCKPPLSWLRRLQVQHPQAAFPSSERRHRQHNRPLLLSPPHSELPLRARRRPPTPRISKNSSFLHLPFQIPRTLPFHGRLCYYPLFCHRVYNLFCGLNTLPYLHSPQHVAHQQLGWVLSPRAEADSKHHEKKGGESC